MELPMDVFLENLKGAWGIVAIVVSAICAWIGYAIKARIDEKKKKSEAEILAETRQKELNEKLDHMIKLEIESNSLENKKLDRIAEGLDMALDCNDVIFESFHRSHIMNGESEAQRIKLKEFRAKLAREALATPPENFNGVTAFEEMLKEN